MDLQTVPEGRPSVRAEFFGRIFGIVVGITITAALVSPRTIAYTMPILTALVFAGLWFEPRIASFRLNVGTVEWTMLVFLAFCVVSMFWALKASSALQPLISALGYFCSSLFLLNAVFAEDRTIALRIAEGICVGLLVGLIYLGFEIATNEQFKLSLYRGLHIPRSWLRPYRAFTWHNDELVAIDPTDLTRNIAPITLLLWSALLALQKIVQPNVARVMSGILFLFAALIIMKSEHETSKVALLWSTLIFLVARSGVERSSRILQVTWVVACLAVIPAALSLQRLNLYQASWIQPSLRERIIIWNHTAEESLRAPIIGAGVGTMHELSLRKKPGEEFSAEPSHAHNVYLQTWRELGAVGAGLLTLIGLATIKRIRRLTESAIPYVQATFASVMAIIAASYGMWQPWFIAMFGMCVIVAAVAIRLCQAEGEKTMAQAT